MVICRLHLKGDKVGKETNAAPPPIRLTLNRNKNLFKDETSIENHNYVLVSKVTRLEKFRASEENGMMIDFFFFYTQCASENMAFTYVCLCVVFISKLQLMQKFKKKKGRQVCDLYPLKQYMFKIFTKMSKCKFIIRIKYE